MPEEEPGPEEPEGEEEPGGEEEPEDESGESGQAEAEAETGEDAERGELLPLGPTEDGTVPANVHPAAWRFARVLRPLFDAMRTSMTAYGVERNLHKSTVSRYLSGVQVAPVDFVENLFIDYVRVTQASPTRQLREHVMQLQSEAMRATNPQGWQIQDLRKKWKEAEQGRKLAEKVAQQFQQALDDAEGCIARSRIEQDTLREEATRLAVGREELLREVEVLEGKRQSAEQRAADYERKCRELAGRLEAAEEAEERAVADREAAAEDARREAERLLRQARRELTASAARRSLEVAGEARRPHVLFAGPDAPWAAWLCGMLGASGAAVSTELLTPVPGESVVDLLEDRLRTADPLVLLSGNLRELGRYTAEEWSEAFRLIGERHPGRLTVVAPDGSAPVAHDGVTVVERAGVGAAEADRLLRRAIGRTEAPSSPGPVERLPTDYPETWGQVPRRDDRFIGRDELLWIVHRELTTGELPPAAPTSAGDWGRSPAVPDDDAHPSDGAEDPAGEDPDATDAPSTVVRVLVGMPGVGKTAAATEYVHRFKGLYDVIWWVDAGSQDTVRSGLARLAEELGAPRGEPGAELDALYTALRSPREPAGHRRILLVFDGAEEPSVLAPMLPGRAVRVLITAQNRAWERYSAELIDVPCFTWAESLACVTRFDPGRGLRGDRTLAQSLGEHPGALVRAMTEHCPGGEVRLPSLTDALGRLHARAPQTRLLLRLSDRFAEGTVPLRWLRPLPTPQSASWDATAHALVETSLARIDADTLHVHPLVRRTAVRGAYDDQLHEVADLAVDALTHADPQLPETPAQWPRYAALLRHLEPSGALDSDAPAARRLVRNCLAYCRWSGAHHQGLHIAARADAGRAALGLDEEPDSELLEVRARLLREAGRLREATRLLDREDVRDGTPHASRHLVAAARAASLLSSGRYDEADGHARTAYEDRLRSSGPDAPGTMQARALLTECARVLGHWDRSLELGTEVLEQYRKVRPWALQALYARSRHALDLRLLGRYGEAEDEQTAALRGLKELLGPIHPQTISAEYELAMCRWHTGHVQDAAARLDRLRRTVLRSADGSPLALHVLAVYSWVARHTTGGDPADISGRQALDGYRAMLPEGHPHLLGLAANAALAAAGSRPEQARSTLEHSWRELSERLGETHPWALGLALGLSGSRCADGDPDGAADLSGKARERAASALGPRHPVTLLLTAAHSADLRALGRDQRAAEFDGLARRELRRHYADHPQTRAVVEGRRPVWEFEPLPLHGLP